MNEVSEELYRLRHSLSHVLAQAMQRYRPGTKLGFGPPVADGFYYDFLLPEPITDEDLPKLEALMREIIAEGQVFAAEDLPIPEALARIGDMGEPYKAEYAKELAEKHHLERLTFYTNGPFLDMCEGPHVENTRQIPRDSFKLHNIAGAYWRGDERNQMLTRVYGWAFENKKELAKYANARAEAVKRDHRKLGAELDLYTMDDHVGPGLPLWLPAGTVVVEELEKLAKEWEFLDGYHRVRTPVLTKGGLYEASGHLALYKDAMFPPMVLDDEDSEPFYLRPMNCPHHHLVFAARPRSYRDLPLRLAEYGHTFRNERSGSLHGLTRVRAMCMNDAHIYTTKDQIREEFARVLDLHRRYYELLGLESDEYFFRLSLWDPDDAKARDKYVDDPASWQFSEDEVRAAMQEVGLPFREVKGEAAFYGPKIDIQFMTVGLKEFTVSTTQLDFAVPRRFVERGIDCTYVDRDGSKQLPYVIHRAPLSTHERFISFLIERWGGAFPMWLAPVQVRFVPVGQDFAEYAHKVSADLRQAFVRAEVDDSTDTLGKKIRQGATQKIPMLAVVGANEVAEGTVTLRRYGIKEQRTVTVAELTAMVRAEIAQRRHIRAWDEVQAMLGG